MISVFVFRANRRRYWICTLIGMLLLFTKLNVLASDPVTHHELSVRLIPSEHRLIGTDTVTLPAGSNRPLEFFLSRKAEISGVFIGGQASEYRFEDGRLLILDGENAPPPKMQITVRYEALFEDPVPVMPVNADNPGYGVTGSISEQGTFILAGAGWYPDLRDKRSTFALSVAAPEGVVAVTAGSTGRRETSDGMTISTWSVQRPIDGLSLSAGRYVVREKSNGRVTAMTFMLPETDRLSADYLDAVLGYIADFEALFGPYPFSKFAVVENFFPTGYGFPSYTLLGSRVIRLPFIIRTSLGHEIAHCWWGNGVFVDYRGGNWCEGLTAYVADYRFKALASPAAAREYRGQMLRNYATLVTPQNDFPLSRFSSRHDPATKVIGYDKGAMVFHMLRATIGDEAFWQALRDVFRERLFQKAAWTDLKQAFEARSNQPLDRFFDQWVGRTGAPRINLEEVAATRDAEGWRVTGRVTQVPPVYDLKLTLRLNSGDRSTDTPLSATAADIYFEIQTAYAPQRLSLDPELDVFRVLYPQEIPPAINSLKGARSVLVLLAPNLSRSVREAADLLVRSLGLKHYEMAEVDSIGESALKENDLLLIGWPQLPLLGAALPESVSLGREGFRLNGRVYDRPEDVFFGVFTHPLANDRIMAVYLPLHNTDAARVARKITHYGKYSYLAFRQSENQDKGTWPPAASPLIHEFPSGDVSKNPPKTEQETP